MSAEFATRIKGERAALADLDARRPRTRVAIGVLVALVYFGILAFAGILISGAVNSLGDRGVVARATVQQLTGAARESTNEAAQTTAPESPRATPAPSAAAAPPPAAVPAPTAPQLSVAVAAPQTAVAVAAPPPAVAPAPTAPPPSVAAAVPPQAPPGPARTHVAALPAVVPPPARPQGDAPDPRALAAAGDARLADGDIASARLYYERAAESGDARAARLLANSYDPAFLTRWGVRGMNGDTEEAARWYKLAGALGDSEAKQDLAALAQR